MIDKALFRLISVLIISALILSRQQMRCSSGAHVDDVHSNLIQTYYYRVPVNTANWTSNGPTTLSECRYVRACCRPTELLLSRSQGADGQQCQHNLLNPAVQIR